MNLRRMPVLGLAIALVCSVGLSAQNDKKRDDAQKKEIQNIVKIVDDASSELKKKRPCSSEPTHGTRRP